MIVIGKTLKMVKGDTERLTAGVDGYDLTENDIVTMIIKDFKRRDVCGNIVSGDTVYLERTAYISDGVATVQILPDDTSNMESGRYVYELRLVTASGNIHTIVPYNFFEVMDG